MSDAFTHKGGNGLRPRGPSAHPLHSGLAPDDLFLLVAPKFGSDVKTDGAALTMHEEGTKTFMTYKWQSPDGDMLTGRSERSENILREQGRRLVGVSGSGPG